MASYPVLTAQPVLLDAYRRGEVRGFPEFGVAHLAWLGACVLLVAVLVRRYRRLRARELAGRHLAPGRRRGSLRLLRGMADVIVGCLVSEDALMVAAGRFTPLWWPLHFCNFAELFCVAYAVRPNRACRELLLTLGLSGGAMAMVFPGWTYCPSYTWPVVCGFVEHALVFAVALCAQAGWRETPRWRDLAISLVFVAVYVGFFRWFNVAFGANFGFVTTPAAGSPLELWAHELGNPGYLVPYAGTFVAVAVALHGCVAIQRYLGRRREAA